MKNDATDLDRMHDIIVPEPISWWPWAPGWYVVLVVLLCAILYLGCCYWQHWRSNHYRRIALVELQQACSIPAVSELLRRTALAVAPRSEIAAKTGSSWTEWLIDRAPVSMPDQIRQQLSAGVYDSTESDCDIKELKAYAAQWIRRHHQNPLCDTQPAKQR
ncbi:DUF4381 domain-containing protein [Gimesia sp.]|uniref:DUF4381 domain-containing protein n=1 Tax=Gimesia sp. TaxID=2024833 RepID=UPI000C3D26ED|nr:DUF4381 domain-containing protein [Gimesia sp.]MAX37782.1 hypothetical protein [Gimesia sp.]HAH44715.1 DUF4381 domain-containing protein [Planctomycetaceae bacterium]HBL44160.1 DUF4381 domain-containing protein [Planctomycetaceae bacterium]|tara:strand:- start:12310 stop:12792 length:483 start_codon:yes stop_codon:yes gene_type:complete